MSSVVKKPTKKKQVQQETEYTEEIQTTSTVEVKFEVNVEAEQKKSKKGATPAPAAPEPKKAAKPAAKEVEANVNPEAPKKRPKKTANPAPDFNDVDETYDCSKPTEEVDIPDFGGTKVGSKKPKTVKETKTTKETKAVKEVKSPEPPALVQIGTIALKGTKLNSRGEPTKETFDLGTITLRGIKLSGGSAKVSTAKPDKKGSESTLGSIDLKDVEFTLAKASKFKLTPAQSLPTLGTMVLDGVLFKTAADDDDEDGEEEEESVVQKKVQSKVEVTTTTTTTITTNVSININVVQNNGTFMVASAPNPADDDFGLPKPTGPKPNSATEELLIFEDLLSLPLYPKNVENIRSKLDGGLYEDPQFTEKSNRGRNFLQ